MPIAVRPAPLLTVAFALILAGCGDSRRAVVEDGACFVTDGGGRKVRVAATDCPGLRPGRGPEGEAMGVAAGEGG